MIEVLHRILSTLRKRLAIHVAILTLVGLASHAIAAPPKYRATPISAGGSRTWAHAINNLGDVAGQGYTVEELPRAYLYADGKVTVIPSLGGWASEARGVNDARQVVGTSGTQDSSIHAFLYSGGILVDLGTLGGPNSHADAINSIGQVVGASILTQSGPEHAFLYGNGTMQDLGSIAPGTSLASDISDNGDIIGWSDGNPGGPFLWRRGVMTRLPLFGAFGINAAGVVAGSVNVARTPAAPLGIRAVVHSNGVTRELEPGGTEDSGASAINNNGWVVGMRANVPVLYLDGSVHDLNGLVVSGLDGVTLRDVRAINDNGQIVANACSQTDGGPCTAFRLDPIPDPGTREVPTLSAWGMCTTIALLGLAAGLSRRAQSIAARRH